MGSFGEAPKGNAKSGEKIFKTKCAQCHAVEKAGGHKQGEKKKTKQERKNTNYSKCAFSKNCRRIFCS